MNFAGVEIGPGNQARVIAEISNNHNGNLDNACRLIQECADAGADWIKFQAYTPAELVTLRGDGPAPEPWGSQGWTLRALYEKAQTPLKWFPELIRECERVGIPWFSSVFGPGSLALLDALGCPAFKLASLDHSKRALHQMVAATGKPVLRSSPLLARRRSEKLTLWCPPGYPQEPPFAFRSAFGPHDGFSYHGTDPDVPAWAVAHGAGIVECHVQLDDVPSELEENVSLTVSQFAYLVGRIEHHGRMVT